MKNDPTKFTRIEGTITTADGETRQFSIDTGLAYQQWGNTQEHLGHSVDMVTAIANSLEEHAYDSIFDSGYAIHIGVHRDNVGPVRTLLAQHPLVVRTYASGDGWQEWDEPPADDDDARHIAIITDWRDEMLAALKKIEGHLVPRTTWAAGAIVFVTAVHDWAEDLGDPITAL